jgi:uncharacterized membrane protein YkvA (DUF1232 family)
MRRNYMPWLAPWKQKVAILKRELTALGLAFTDARTPWYARALLLVVLGYALSPLDLIPDFIPILGLLDDLLLLPLGIALVLRVLPPAVLADCRRKAQEGVSVPTQWRRWSTVVIVGSWLILAGVLLWWLVIITAGR